jgi:hypothetical protein
LWPVAKTATALGVTAVDRAREWSAEAGEQTK